MNAIPTFFAIPSTGEVGQWADATVTKIRLSSDGCGLTRYISTFSMKNLTLP